MKRKGTREELKQEAKNTLKSRYGTATVVIKEKIVMKDGVVLDEGWWRKKEEREIKAIMGGKN